MKAREERLVYDLKDLAKEVKIGVRTLREHVKRGDLKAKKVGRAYLVTEKALMDFVERR